MSLTTGSRLGPYEIVAPVGAGGMGEVYRARDTRLNRDVALKILPADVATDPGRRLRFEQEARAAAALNHPNIVAIYDVGTHDDVFFIVSELVNGEMLREVKLGLRKALDCAVQIATGLAAAHAAGIVHRDLKPENVLLTRDGRIKILDFGLARFVVDPVAAGELATLTVHTAPGVVLGTVGYMSPEQIKGLPADQRSDIFSFGVILYEMLGGSRAFHGDTAVETMTAILRHDPPELPDTIPSAVRQIAQHCLEKDPANRFQSARDLAFALAAIAQSGPQTAVLSTPAPRPAPWRRTGIQVAAAVLLVATGVAGGRLLLTGPPSPPEWSGGVLGGPEMAIDPRVSPNGDLLAFEAFEEGVTQVAVMKPETGNWSILTHDRTRGTLSFLSWAPDGSSIYYMRNVPEAVYRVPVLGGEERLILENAGPAEALPDGSLLVVKLNAQRQPQLHRYWPDSGRLQELPLLMPGKFNATFGFRPTADGKQIVAFGTLVGHELEGHRLRVIDLATGASTTLASAPLSIGLAGAAVSHDGKSLLLAMPSGSLTRIVSIPTQGRSSPRTLFTVANNVWYLDAARDGSVYASVMDRPVEIVRRTLDGSRSEPVARFPMQAPPDIVAVLPDGRAVTEQILAGKSRIVAAERNKDPQPLVATSDETSTPLTVVPPRQIGFMIGAAPRRTIALADTSTGRITSRIETNKGDVDSLAASPDGRRLFFAAGGAVWSVASSGGEVQRVRSGDHVVMDPSGRYLIVSAIEDNTFKFFRVFVDGRPEEQITTDGSLPIMNYPSSPGALAADGRLLVPLVDAWFNRPAVLDTTTGRITKLPSDDVSDYHSMAWLPDGRIMALHVGLRSTLWRFRPNR